MLRCCKPLINPSSNAAVSACRQNNVGQINLANIRNMPRRLRGLQNLLRRSRFFGVLQVLCELLLNHPAWNNTFAIVSKIMDEDIYFIPTSVGIFAQRPFGQPMIRGSSGVFIAGDGPDHQTHDFPSSHIGIKLGGFMTSHAATPTVAPARVRKASYWPP